MDQQQPVLPEKKKRGRPKGSKDRPRQPGDKPRGRPRKVPEPAVNSVVDGSINGAQITIMFLISSQGISHTSDIR